MRIIRMYSIIFLSLVSLKAQAWGLKGHKTMAEIAFENLDLKTKSKIKKLIGELSLADICLWADQVRQDRDYKHTAPWHFVDIPDGETYDSIDRNPDGDVVEAINGQIRILNSPYTSTSSKVEALKFVVHFYGDIHQPLHVGRPDDKGGNLVQVFYKGQSVNLHYLWDSVFIEEEMMTPKDLAAKIVRNLRRPEYANNTSVKQLTTEALNLRNQVYSFVGNDISSDYEAKAKKTIEEKIYLSGLRLANLLNQVIK